jgi:hypothetical protein
MSKAFLNQHGLRKLLPYLEGIVPGIRNKLVIEGNHLKIRDEDFDILIRIPITEQAPLPSQAAMPTQASGPTAATPTSQLPASKAVSKGPEQEVSQIGRAGARKDEEEMLEKLIEKLSKHFTTRKEFDEYLSGAKSENEKADAANTFEQIAALLKK